MVDDNAPTSPTAIFIDDRLADADISAGTATVTVVDVADAVPRAPDASAEADIAARLVASFRHTGFAVITGHGVAQDLFDRFCEQSAAFFALPLEEKTKVGFPAPDVIRGYEPVPDDSGPARAPNLMESFLINQLEPVRDHAEGSPQARLWRWPNLWPERPPALRGVWEEYYRAMTALGDRLLELVALGVGLRHDWFADKFDRHFNNLAANHYPPRRDIASSEMPRNRPHTDHGALTLLYRPSEPGGLEVFAAGQWWQVPFIPGSLVLNIGDVLERWTGGQLPATPHRVVNAANAAGVGRYSVAYFQQPNPDALIVPALPVADGHAGYTPVLAGEHISRKELGYHAVAAALHA